MDANKRFSYRLLITAAMLACCGVLAISIDVPVSQWWSTQGLPGDLRKLVTLAEFFGHGCGAALILVGFFVLLPNRRRQLPRLTACAFASGMLANVGKGLVQRTRPYEFDYTSPITASFTEWFPFFGEHADQSFPSGHTALAFGLAVGLLALFPRGRWLFLAYASLAACQRMNANVHFLSDVLCGAAVGCLGPALCYHSKLLGRWFDQIELPVVPTDSTKEECRVAA